MDTLETELRRRRPPAIPGNELSTRPGTPPVQSPRYSSSFTQGVDPRSCWHCNLTGHIARDCPTHTAQSATTYVQGNGQAGSENPSNQRS